MVLAGAAAGVCDGDLPRQRAGLDRELIWSMAFWLFIGGMIGGRLFYVIEYWDERFRTDSFRETLLRILNFPEGGLVIYGALFGGVVGGAVVHSQASAAGAGDVRPDRAEHGDRPGARSDRLLSQRLLLRRADDVAVGRDVSADESAVCRPIGRRRCCSATNPPFAACPCIRRRSTARSRPALIGWFLWSYYPFRRRDGEVIALMLMIYPSAGSWRRSSAPTNRPFSARG